MADDEKAKLYRELVRGADDLAVLERMRVNGFWPRGQSVPQDPPDERRERAELERALAKMRADGGAALEDPQKLLAEFRKRRWEESKRVRAEKRRLRDEALRKKREAWEQHRRTQIVYLGVGVSAGLVDTSSAGVERLREKGLPALTSGNDLAMMLGVPLATLRWLCFHRRGAALVHYHRFAIPKKTGGTRAISAPKPRLAKAQRWVWKNILEKIEPSAEAHGFVKKRSTVSNATPHVARRVVLNLDLKDFFPTVTFRRVKGLFQSFGYNEHVATVLGLLCTEPPRVLTEFDGRTLYVALGQRVLPQGACTSPAITNILCRHLDARLLGLGKRHGCSYTRYADDLTFSGDAPRVLGRLLRSTRSILAEEGFVEQTTKTKVMHRACRQEVTGLSVNERVGIPRKYARTLQAILYNCARNGMASQNRENHPAFASHLRGHVEYLCSVDPAKAERFRELLARALGQP